MIYRESEASEEEKDTGGIDDKDEVLLSQFDNLSVSLEDLSVKKLRRLHDLVSLAPTSFQELSEEWGVSIDDARKYSRSELSEYYEVKSTGISPTARASGKIKSFRKKLETEIIEVTDYDPQTYRDRFGSIENLYFEDLEEDLYGESVLELSSDGLRVNRVFKRPLTGGQTEVTIEEIKPASLPREGLNLHVKTIQVDREGKVRLYFKRTSKSKSDTEYLLYPTPEGGKLKEMRERVFDEGEKEVTVESIDSDQGLIKDVGLQVLKINLDAEVGGQDIPVLKLTEVRED
jgi:hypothetical protein